MIKTQRNMSELAKILDGKYEIRHMPSYKYLKTFSAIQLEIISLLEEREAEATINLIDLLKNHGYECNLLDGRQSIKRGINRRYDLFATKDGVDFVFEIKKESKNRKRFKRVRRKREDRVIESLKSLSKLKDRSNYNYTDSDIREIEETLLAAVHKTISEFELPSKKEGIKIISNKSETTDYQLKKIESLMKKQEKSQKELIKLSEELRTSMNDMNKDD